MTRPITTRKALLICALCHPRHPGQVIELTVHPLGRTLSIRHHQLYTRMADILTIPTEIRLKILNYAISDLSGSESLIKRVDIPWEVSEEYYDLFVRKLRRGTDQRYLKNPNVNVPLVCRQIRMECNSPQVRKPTLDVEDGDIKGHASNWPVLYDWDGLDIAKMMAQLSTLRMCYLLGAEVKQFRLRGSKRNQEEYRQRLLDRLVSRLAGGNRYRATGYCRDDFEIATSSSLWKATSRAGLRRLSSFAESTLRLRM